MPEDLTGPTERLWLGWHVARDDRRLDWGDGREIREGETLSVPEPVRCGVCGLHASASALEALMCTWYVFGCRRGSAFQRVALDRVAEQKRHAFLGTIAVAPSRTCLWIGNARWPMLKLAWRVLWAGQDRAHLRLAWWRACRAYGLLSVAAALVGSVRDAAHGASSSALQCYSRLADTFERDMLHLVERDLKRRARQKKTPVLVGVSDAPGLGEVA